MSFGDLFAEAVRKQLRPTQVTDQSLSLLPPPTLFPSSSSIYRRFILVFITMKPYSVSSKDADFKNFTR